MTDPARELVASSDASLATAHLLPLETHPCFVYLARLSLGSRRAQGEALERIARLLTSDARGMLDFPWPHLRYQHAQAVRTWLVSRFAGRTVNRWLAALRMVARESWKLGLMPAEEAQRIATVAGVRVDSPPAGRHVEPAELAALLRAAGPRDAALFALLYGAGLRRAEAAGLELEDVDLDRGRLEVAGKGNKTRIVFLPEGALAVLRAWVEKRGSWAGPFLCPVRDGRVDLVGITPQSVYAAVRRLTWKARLPKGLTPHDLRRSWVSALLDAGADLAMVQKLAGHADPRTTAWYDRRDERARACAAAMLPFPSAKPPA